MDSKIRLPRRADPVKVRQAKNEPRLICEVEPDSATRVVVSRPWTASSDKNEKLKQGEENKGKTIPLNFYTKSPLPWGIL